MKLNLNVNKVTLERILSGEQDEIYLRNYYHWQRKLTHPLTLRNRHIDRFYISNGTKENRRIITAKYEYFTMRAGRPEWKAPEGEVIVVKFTEPILLVPPYHDNLRFLSVRNRIK